MSETKTPAVPYLQQLLVDGQIWFCTEIFCQFSFCQEILIKLSGDTLNNLSNNLGSFRRILQGMGIYRQNIYYRACLWCGLRTLKRIFLHGQLWLKTFLRFELNFYWILIPVEILLPLKSKYIKTQLDTGRQCMQVEVWKCGSIIHCVHSVQCPVSATIKLIAAQCLPCLLSPLAQWAEESYQSWPSPGPGLPTRL